MEPYDGFDFLFKPLNKEDEDKRIQKEDSKVMEQAAIFDVLHKALLERDEYKRIQTLRHLIDNGVDVNSCWNKKCKLRVWFESEGFTVLMVAVSEKYVDCVQVLLDAGANVNQRDAKSQTALIKSASKGHVECMKLLLEAGADVDQSNWFGETALTHAASKGYVECVRLLIEAGVNVNYEDKIKRTALTISANGGYVECMELLLEAGTNVNGVDINGNTLLIRCMEYFQNFDYSNKHKACLKLLINAGFDIDAPNNSNLQPIHYALKRWQRLTFLVEYLISENCNLSQVSYKQVVKACVDKYLYRNSSKLDLNDRLDMLKLLFACGLPRHLYQSFIVEQDASVRNWIETLASQPHTLKSICVFKIRRNLGLGIKFKVTKLNLPNVIQNLILLKEILSVECFE